MKKTVILFIFLITFASFVYAENNDQIIIVMFKHQLSENEVRQFAQQYNLEPRYIYAYIPSATFVIPNATIEEWTEILSRDSRVQNAGPDAEGHAQGSSDNNQENQQNVATWQEASQELNDYVNNSLDYSCQQSSDCENKILMPQTETCCSSRTLCSVINNDIRYRWPLADFAPKRCINKNVQLDETFTRLLEDKCDLYVANGVIIGNPGIFPFPKACECINSRCTVTSVGNCLGETDGGENYYVKGTVTFLNTFYNENINQTDLCDDSNQKILHEYVCITNSTYLRKQFKCPNGCQDGACNPLQNCSTVDVNFCIGGEIVESKEINKEGCPLPAKCQKSLSNGRKAEIKIMPQTASQKAIERLGELNFNVELKEIGNDKVAYELSAEKEAKLFGFIKAKAKIKTYINAETGDVISIKKPWWSFLASGI